MTDQTDISGTLQKLKESAPAGYALAFHVRFTTPTYLFQTYPKVWSDHYSKKGLVMSDPTVAWAFENLGTRRWSELAELDHAGVLQQAATYGLQYGVTIAVDTDGSRSMASFAHATREFSDNEIKGLSIDVHALHEVTARVEALSPETANMLKKLSVNVGPGARS